MPSFSRSIYVRYGVAVASVAVAVLARMLLDRVLGDLFPFVTVLFAVLVAARFGGFGPALLAGLLGAVGSAWLLLPPRGSFAVQGVENQAGLVLYLGVGLGIALLGGAMRAAQERWRATAADAVRQREELRTTLASIGDAVLVTDAKGRVVSLNPVAERLTGWRTAEAVGQPLGAVFAIVNEQTRQAIESPVARVLREGTVVGLANHTLLIAKDKSERPIDDSAAPVLSGDGQLTGVVLVFRDVTERRAAERVVREQAQALSGILAATVDHIYVVNREGRYRLVSAGGARVLGLEPTDLIGKHWRDLGLPADIMECFDAQRERVLQCGVPTVEEVVFRTPQGEDRHFEYVVAPVKGEGGQAEAVVVVSRDTTERRRAEEALRRSERELADFFENATVGLHWVGPDGTILRANQAELDLLGYTREEYVGRHIAEFHADEVVIGDILRCLQAGEKLRDRPARMRCKDGAAKDVLIDSSVMWEDGRFVHTRCFTRDVTDRRKAEAALRESEERFRGLMEQAPFSVQVFAPDGRTVRVNRAWEELWGVTLDQIADYNILYDRQLEQKGVLPLIHRAFAGESVEIPAIEYDPNETIPDRTRHDDPRRWVAAVAYPLKDAGGRVREIVLVHEDRTARTRAEEALRESEERFRAAVDQATVGVALVGPDNRTLFVNRGLCAILGYTEAELRAGSFIDVTHPDDLALDYAQMPRLVSGEVASCRYEKRYVHKDGSVVWADLSVSAVRDGHGEIKYVVGVVVDITERRLAHEALRQSEERFSRFMRHLPGLAWIKDAEGRYVYANDAAVKIFRHDREELYGRTDDELFPPETAAQFKENDRQALASGTGVQVVERLEHADGVIHYSLVSKFPIPASDGRAALVGGMAIDITERRQAEQAVRESEERLRLALEAGRMGVWDWNVKTGVLGWSENLEPIHGLAPGTFGGTLDAFRQVIHPDDRALVSRAIQESLECRSSYDIEFRIVWPDGSAHWMAGKGKVFCDEDGQPARMVGVGMDVTERRRAEQDARFLADASAALAGLVDYESTLQKVARLAVPNFADWCAVDMLDEAGALRRVAVAHVDPSKVELAHELHRRYPPDPAAPQGVWNVVRTGKSEIVPEIGDERLAATVPDAELLRILRELGLKSYMGVPLAVRGRVLGVVTFIAAESGRRYAAADLAVAEDLAHRAAVAIDNARLYQALKEADRRKDEFLALLGHELRNPLAPISNALHVLKLPGADAAITGRAREMMERQVEHMVRLVDDLLDVSRIMRGKVQLRREPVELATAVARAVETSQPVIDAEGHRLTVSLPPEPLWVHGDLVRLAQVVSNLVNNAAKYTERGGQISLAAVREVDEAVLRVRDTGIGIAPELLPRLFDMFFQAERRTKDSQGGLGIGLSLVRGLVELHGGSVEARSAGPGQGSEFVVRLPLLERDERSSDRRNRSGQESEGKLAPRRVLVVDDNVDAADSLAMLLRLQGQEVAVAYDGPSALAKAEADPPAIAFLDLGMPRMDGYELARAFRARPALKGVLLVALTGWGQPEDRQRTREAGFDHHLVKPVEADALHRLFGERV